jgi:hypothetical protein
MEKMFLVILILQMSLYGLVDYKKVKHGRLLILGIFLLIYIAILPNFYPVPENSLICYTNPFEYFSIFWAIGLSLIVAAHFVYIFLINKKTTIA